MSEVVGESGTTEFLPQNSTKFTCRQVKRNGTGSGNSHLKRQSPDKDRDRFFQKEPTPFLATGMSLVEPVCYVVERQQALGSSEDHLFCTFK